MGNPIWFFIIVTMLYIYWIINWRTLVITHQVLTWWRHLQGDVMSKTRLLTQWHSSLSVSCPCHWCRPPTHCNQTDTGSVLWTHQHTHKCTCVCQYTHTHTHTPTYSVSPHVSCTVIVMYITPHVTEQNTDCVQDDLALMSDPQQLWSGGTCVLRAVFTWTSTLRPLHSLSGCLLRGLWNQHNTTQCTCCATDTGPKTLALVTTD